MIAPAPPAHRLLTVEDIAKLVGKHVQTVRAWVKSGRLPFEPVPGPKCPQLFRPADVARWLEGESPAPVVELRALAGGKR